MRKRVLLAVVFILLIPLVAPYSVLAGSSSEAGGVNSGCWDEGKDYPNCGFAKGPENVSHSLGLRVIFVGYDESVVDVAALDNYINRYYEMQYWDAYLKYSIKTDYAFADDAYLDELRDFVVQNSVNSTGTTSAINTTALEYQRETGTPMSIFLPQSGRAIDAHAVEQWFEDNPYGHASGDANGYTFYVLNFTEFDSADHSLEHWFNLTRNDLDAQSINDYWRLEWDNPLNPDVKFPYPAFTSRYRLLFIDPSAFQWYLTWTRIWWELDDYLAGPKYAYYYQDLEDFVASNNVSSPEGKDALAQYLSGWIDDFLYNLVSPVGWVMTGNTLSLQVMVLNNVSDCGYPNEKMQWILNTTLVEKAIEALAPYIKVKVTIRYENLSSYPEIADMVNSSLIEEKDGWRYYDGFSLFYNLQAIRDQYFNMKEAEMTVNSYVFLMKNATFETSPGGMQFTGLGGMQQVLILMSIDRYFRADGVTPKAGLSMALIHELGHNIAFPHTFSFLKYAGDFSEDTMGYFSYFYTFCKLREDIFRRTVVDFKLLELKKALRTDVCTHWPWPQKTLFFRNYLLKAIKLNIDRALRQYERMDYLASYYSMIEAENLEAYLREIVSGIRVPGDINGDGKCDRKDVCLFLNAFGSTPGSPNWNPDADLNKDRRVNWADFQILRCFYGQKAKVTVGFFKWNTGARSSTIDYGTFIFPDYDMPYSETNITYGLQNWDDKPHSCFVRISDMTFQNLMWYVKVTIYNETGTITELTWTNETSGPSKWVKLNLDASSRYSITVELQGTAEAYYEMTVTTLECKQTPSSPHPHGGKP